MGTKQIGKVASVNGTTPNLADMQFSFALMCIRAFENETQTQSSINPSPTFPIPLLPAQIFATHHLPNAIG